MGSIFARLGCPCPVPNLPVVRQTAPLLQGVDRYRPIGYKRRYIVNSRRRRPEAGLSCRILGTVPSFVAGRHRNGTIPLGPAGGLSENRRIVTTGSRYWCQRHLLITVTGPRKQATVTVPTPYARIGSHPESEVVLPDASVAPRGLYLHATDDGVIGVGLCHDASAGALFRGWLLPEQKVSLGPYQISARLSADSRPQTSVPPAGRSPAVPCPVLTFSRRGREITQHRLRRRLTIVGRGRPARCDCRTAASRRRTASSTAVRTPSG